MRSIARVFLASAIFAAPAFASQEAPQLPTTAKKLSAQQIMKLYNGHTFTFTTYTSFGAATGTVTYDFKTMTNHGHYQLGSYKGEIEGVIRMDGDHFCYKVHMDSEHCDFLYVAGGTIYDINPSGSVRSVNTRQ